MRSYPELDARAEFWQPLWDALGVGWGDRVEAAAGKEPLTRQEYEKLKSANKAP